MCVLYNKQSIDSILIKINTSITNRILKLFNSLKEAHLLDREMLEEVRFLLDFRMDSQSPMALILIGESELWNKFNLQSYTAIRQQIDIQCKLVHFDRSQTGEYVETHLTYAGVEHDIFSDQAVDEIFRFSGGAARMVNKVCTHCLIYPRSKRQANY